MERLHVLFGGCLIFKERGGVIFLKITLFSCVEMLHEFFVEMLCDFFGLESLHDFL